MTGMTFVCPEGPTKLITLWKTHPYLVTTTTLQCYVTIFLSTTKLWTYNNSYQYFFGGSKTQYDKHISIELPYKATPRESMEWDLATTLWQHPFCSSQSALQTHDQWHDTYHTFHFTWRVNRRCSINLDTIFSHRSLCNSYRIAYTSRIGDILLLFLSVLTFQISMPTFTTRYHAIYYCGCWCRGSTHLQMQWQGQTAQKTSQESWPVYGSSTYMDKELTEAADTVISSPYMQIIGIHFQNPREHRNVPNICCKTQDQTRYCNPSMNWLMYSEWQ